MKNISTSAWRCCAKVHPGAKHTKSEAADLPVSEVFSRPEFMVLGVGNHHPRGRGQRFGAVLKPHVHPVDRSNQRMVFVTPEGAKAMTTTSTTPTPKSGNLETALRAILSLVQ